MFCPNCGRNCGDDNFCASCGRRLKGNNQQATSSDAQSIGTVPQSASGQNASPDIPTSISYLGRRGVVLLYESAVSISTGSGEFKKRIEIPFDQLVTVVYMRPSSNGWHDGVLLLRGEANKSKPIPEIRHMAFDDAAATIPLEKDILFYHVYCLLKAVAPHTAKFEMIIPKSKIKRLDELGAGIDFDSLWNRFAPFRESAVKEICNTHKIKPEAARVLVDRDFDARQKLRYEADPFDAIRDLKLLVDAISKKDQNISRLKAELKEDQKREEIERSLNYIGIVTSNDK